jgi:cytochrome c oxidase assembly factor CtaG
VQLAEMPPLAHAEADTGLPAFTPAAIFTQIHLAGLLTLLLPALAALYGYGVHRLRLRGDHWPIGRTVAFVVGGLGSIAFVTMSGLEAYDDTLLSVHMVQHMALAMVGPIFLALGAPVTLALRTLHKGPRTRLLSVLHSRLVKVLTYPLVAFGIFVANPFVLYFTGLYRESLEHDWLHELTHVHFILTGCLFFWPLLGLDPLPNRWPYPGRALLMVVSVPFHTVLGLTIMQSKTLLAGDYYPSLGLSWANPWNDQVTAGGILWSGGELVSVTMLAILIVQWIRQSEREARRIDRALDRAEAAAGRDAAAREEVEAGAGASKITSGISKISQTPRPRPDSE